MGDFRAGNACGSGVAGAATGVDVDGSPSISCSSVTTKPFVVIWLLRIIRLCGKRFREVCMYSRTAELLRSVRTKTSRTRNTVTYSLTPEMMSTIKL
jgi:hypothetical protein